MKRYFSPKLAILVLLATITLLGGIIRFYHLGSTPAGFFCDEAGQTYNAYTLLKTGKDFRGNFFPFYINIFGPIGPVAVYDQIPAVAFFGLNEFASRSTAAFIGTLTILIVYFLAIEIFGNSLTALFAALLTAISPWHIQFSRFGTENIRVPFYFSLSLLFILIGITRNKKIYIILSLIFTYLCFYSYTATNLFLPPFMLGTLIIYRKFFFKNSKFLLLLIILAIFFTIPFVNDLLTFRNDNRFAVVSVFHNHSVQEGITAMAKTYVESYSPDFLLLKGDAGMPGHYITRFSVKGMGELYLFTFPFLIIGLLILLINRHKPQYQLLLLWLLLYPIGSVLAGADGGGPFATRSIIGVLAFQFITAFGIIIFFSWITSKNLKILFISLFSFIMLLSAFHYLYQYFIVYPTYSLDFWGWQYGAGDIVRYFAKNQAKYDEEILIPAFNAPGIFFKFYAPNDCKKCKVGLLISAYNPSKRQLFAVTPFYIIMHSELTFQIDTTITYPNGFPAFYIGEVKNYRDNKRIE